MPNHPPGASASDSCRGEPGRVAPVIDRELCEAKADCVRVCPYDVFEIRRLEPRDRAALSFVGRLRALAHRHRQAYVVRPADCHACQMCVAACPEHAITLAAWPG